MTITMRYGSKNKKDSKSQYIYLRIKHNNLDWDKSLKVKIEAKDWDFKKGEITHKHSFGNPIHSQNLKEISQMVNSTFYALKHKAEEFSFSNRFILKEWVQDKNRKAFIDECETWYREYLETKQIIRQPYITDLYKEFITQRHKIGEIGNQRLTRVNNIHRNLLAFEHHYGRRIRTDELSTELWVQEMIPYFREDYEHGMFSEALTKKGTPKSFSGIGIEDSTIKTIKDGIQQVARKKGNKYNFHWDILNDDSFTIKPTTKPKLFLNENQVQSILEFNGSDVHNLANKKWFFSMLFYGCFRISEVYISLEGKTPKQVWENEITKRPNAEGELVYYWKCANLKQSGEIHNKNLPMFEQLGELLFGGFKNAESGNFPNSFPKLFARNTYRNALKEIAKKVDIEGRIISHTMRRSFLNNLKKKRTNHSDMMQYSGHQTESALLSYLDASDNYVPTEVKLNQ